MNGGRGGRGRGRPPPVVGSPPEEEKEEDKEEADHPLLSVARQERKKRRRKRRRVHVCMPVFFKYICVLGVRVICRERGWVGGWDRGLEASQRKPQKTTKSM